MNRSAACLFVSLALVGIVSADMRSLDFESDADLQGLRILGPVALDTELAHSGKSSLRLDPGAAVEWKVADADGCGVLQLWVFDNMGCPPNVRGYYTGPRWGLRQDDGTVFAISELFAGYLGGADQYITSEAKANEKGKANWLSGLQHFGRNARSGGWHLWTLVVDPEKGIDIFHDGQSCTFRSRFDPKKVTLKGFSSVVLYGCQEGENSWSIWFDDASVETTGAAAPVVDIQPVEPPLPPAAYSVTAPANAIAVTAGALAGTVDVVGEPRKTIGHPCTTWDMEDVAHYKEMMASSPLLKAQADALRAALDKRILEPVAVPQPRKDADGNPVHVSDTETGKIHNALGLDIANLGAAYLLFGDDRYAEYAKKLLLAYADAVPAYGVGARPGFNHDPSRVFDQRLSDAIWMLQVARGYDFIYNYKGITPEERRHIQDDLIVSEGRFIAQNTSSVRAATNWSAIDTAAILACGLACDDEWLVHRALFGMNFDPGNPRVKTPPLNWWEGTPNRAPSGVELHFSEKSIDVDGMWNEGAMGYQFMAMQALICDAEMLWHHGIDLYRYRGGALKRLFDSPLQFAYPDLTTPAIHDSSRTSIIGYDSYLYEFAYRRYRDPAYLSILRLADRRLAAAYQQFTVSVLYDVDTEKASEPVPAQSVNLNGVGYGILRIADGLGVRSLLLDYGPNRSHGHPDKLNLDLWMFGDLRVPDPGSTWYEQPIYRRWYHTTASHNTLLVDQQSQRPAGAEQLVYAPGETLGIQRARTTEAWPGVAMDRSLFLTADYVADLFGAFSEQPHIYDLAWHPTGECTTDLALDPVPAPGLTAIGYNTLGDPRIATADGGYRVNYVDRGQPLALIAAEGGPATQVILGEGTLGRTRPTAVYQRRRKTTSTIYGNVLDISEKGVVKKVQQSGSREDQMFMDIDLADGGLDTCYVNYQNNTHLETQSGFATDACQAFLRRDADRLVYAAVLGGGTKLHDSLWSSPATHVKIDPSFSLTRSAPGLAVFERTETGTYILANPSSEAAEISVTIPKAYGRGGSVRTLAPDGRPLDPVPGGEVAKDGLLRVMLPAGGRVEISAPGAVSMYDFRKDVLLRLERERIEAERKAREEALERVKARKADAATFAVPKKTLVVVQAEDFVGEGGGKVAKADNKTASIGTALSLWNDPDHWLEWTVAVPAEGYYHVALCYCAQNSTVRALSVNGVENPDAESVTLAATGGWSNGTDDWQILPIPDPTIPEEALLVKLAAGENTIRITNVSGGGSNLDYLMVYSPDVTPERLEK